MSTQYVNKLKEAVEKDPELGASHFSDMIRRAEINPFFQRALKEGLYADMSQALGEVHSVVIEAAKKMAVGRDIMWIVPTRQPLVRFYLAKRGKAWRIGETKPLAVGERFSKTDLELKYEYAYAAEWTKDYLEDVPFNVLQRNVADIGQILEEQLTTDIKTLYEAVAAGNLASGAEISAETANKLAWADLVNARQAIVKEGFKPDVAIVHPDQIADLWKDDKFIHGFYFGEKVDVERGVLGTTYLGFKIVECDIFTATKVHMLDTRYAAACILRRDLLTEPYENPAELTSGVIGSMRYGMGTLRTKALARITGA